MSWQLCLAHRRQQIRQMLKNKEHLQVLGIQCWKHPRHDSSEAMKGSLPLRTAPGGHFISRAPAPDTTLESSC